MKSKITLIILLVVIIFLGALSFFFGYKYLNIKSEISTLNERIDVMTKLVENMDEEQKDTVEKEENIVEEVKEDKINKTTYYESEDKKYLLTLVEYENRKISSKNTSDPEKYFVLVESYPQTANINAGSYYFADNTIRLIFNKENVSYLDVEIQDIYGTTSATLNYSEEEGVIYLGNVKLIKK